MTPHETRPVSILVDVDLGIADMVEYLQMIPGVRTHASCEGTPTMPAYVMATWHHDLLPRLQREFNVELVGEMWGYLRPRLPAAPPDQETP